MGESEKRIWSGRRWAFAAFLGIMLLHSLAILLFTRGFLLTRTELSQYSECNDVVESPCFPPPRDQNTNGSCWSQPVVGRLVIIVLDALRLTLFAIARRDCFILYLFGFLPLFVSQCLWGVLVVGLILSLPAHFSQVCCLLHQYNLHSFCLLIAFLQILLAKSCARLTQELYLCFLEKKPWMDKLQVMHDLAAWNHSSTRIFKAIADPPTTSLQRLKVNTWYFLLH